MSTQTKSPVLFFSRDGELYSLPLHSGRPQGKPTRRFSFAKVSGDNGLSAWTVSADGRTLYWLYQDPKVSPATKRGYQQASVVLSADLSRPGGNSRVLFRLPYRDYAPPDDMRPVDGILRGPTGSIPPLLALDRKALAPDNPGSFVYDMDGSPSYGDDSDLDPANWIAIRLLLDSNSQTLFLTLNAINPPHVPRVLTFAVNLRTCRAITDAQGRWKMQFACEAFDLRNGVMTGIGYGHTKDNTFVEFAASLYNSIRTAEIARPGSEMSFYPHRASSTDLTPYALADCPSLSPDGRMIAFFALKSREDKSRGDIWLVDRHTRRYRRLIAARNITLIRWADATTLFMRDDSGDLYCLPLHPNGHVSGHPVRLLEDIDLFQIVDASL